MAREPLENQSTSDAELTQNTVTVDLALGHSAMRHDAFH